MGMPWPALVLLSTLPLAAQAPERVACFGIVRDHDGKPLAQAEVTIAAGAPGGGRGPADVVRSTTGADGRFRLALLPGRKHFAWATVADANGARVTAGKPVTDSPIELQFTADDRAAPTRLQVTGAHAWRQHGPLQVQLVLPELGEVVPAGTLDADGQLPLPALPPVDATVLVSCNGRVVFVETIDGSRTVHLPPPHRLRARVHLVGGDEPVAGATIELLPLPEPTATPDPWQRIDAERLPLAETAADGTAELLVASELDPWSGPTTRKLLFVASHPGHRESISGFVGSAFLDGRMQPEVAPAQPELTFVMRTDDEAVVPLRSRAGAWPTTVRIGGLGTVPNERGRGQRPHWQRLRSEPGEIRRSISARSWFRGIALELPAMLPPLAADDPFQRVAQPLPMMLPLRSLDRTRGIDLDTVVACRVQVLDATGGPAVGVTVMLLPGQLPTEAEIPFAVRVATDRAGRAVLPSLPGPGFVVALGDGAFGGASIDLGTDPAPVQLRLRPFDRLRVRCVDVAGKPLPDVRFELLGSRWNGEPEGHDRLLRALVTMTLTACRTDADGRAELPFLAHELLQQDVRAVLGRREAHLQLTVGDDVIEVELR